MGARTDEKTIRGLRVTVTQLPPFDGLALSATLLKTAGPTFAPLLPGLLNAGIGAESDLKAVAEALGSMDIAEVTGALASLDVQAIKDIARQVLVTAAVIVNGERIELNTTEKINRAFDGSLRALLEAIWFAITVNFEGFTDGSASAAPSPSPKAA